jgi:hypothetical protein
MPTCNFSSDLLERISKQIGVNQTSRDRLVFVRPDVSTHCVGQAASIPGQSDGIIFRVIGFPVRLTSKASVLSVSLLLLN